MTEQTDAAEALAELIVADTDEPMWSAVVIAKHILASDWLAAREAAAEVRGAQAVLAAVEGVHTASVVMQWMNPLDGPAYQEEEWSCDICGWFPTGEACETLTAARAAAAAAGGGAP